MEFAGKVVLVAGASGGINFRIAQRFAEAGACVAVISRSLDRITAAAEQLRRVGADALGLAADVRDYAAVADATAQAAASLGPIDVVVSGAAGNFLARADEMSANAFRTVVEIDLIGTFNVARASFGYLKKPGASLISISAPQGSRPANLQAHVCAAKAGVNMLTKALALEWGPTGVRVNAISPGPIAGTEGMARMASTPELESEVLRRLPLRRFGAMDDIAEAALFLASDRAKFITGAILDVDGGSVHVGAGL